LQLKRPKKQLKFSSYLPPFIEELKV